MKRRLEERTIRLGIAVLTLVAAHLPGSLYAQDELVIVSPHWEGVRIEFEQAFKKDYRARTGREVDLKWLDVGGASDILKFLRSEFRNKPEGIGVDVFFGGGTDPFIEMERLGHLTPVALPPEIADGLAREIGGVPLQGEGGNWYAATMAGFGIIYNKLVLEKLKLTPPRTWADLAHPAFRSWVGSADPRKSGSVHMAYEIILQAYGWERGWEVLTALGANVRGFSSNAAATPKDVTVGEVAVGLSIDSYAWHQVKEAGEEVIGFVMPDDLTVVNGDAIALLRGAENAPVARAFIAFVLSETGQKLWILRQGEPDGPQSFELGKFSVRPDLYPKIEGRTPVKLNPFTWTSSFVYDAEKGSRRWTVVNDLIGTQIIDAHGRLKETPIDEENLKRMAAVPVTEDEADALSELWRDAGFRSETVSVWSGFAREKYGEASANYLSSLPALLALACGGWMFVRIRRSR